MNSCLLEMNPDDFWQYLERLVAGSRVIIDRPKGSRHPQFPNIVYPLDYGYRYVHYRIDITGDEDRLVGRVVSETVPPA